MNKNVIIGILAAAVVIIGGILIYSSYSSTLSTTSTSTPQVQTPAPSEETQASVPSVSTNGSDLFVSNSTALVTGKVTPNGAQTAYWYDYGNTPALGTRTSPQTIGSGFVAIPAPAYITGLAANTLYYFRLSAQNAYGTVNGATNTFTTNSNPPPSGSAPTIRTENATDVSRTTANLNGHVDPNNSSTSYWFEYGKTTDLGNATALQGAGSGDTSLAGSVSLSNLKPLTKYYFRLNAQNQYGTVNGSILSFTTPGPAAPDAPQADTTSATSVTSSSATLNGRVNPEGDQTTYWFEYGTDSLLGSVIHSTTKSAVLGNGTSNVSVSADIDTLSANTKYYYRAVAQNSYGTVRGDVVSLTTNR